MTIRHNNCYTWFIKPLNRRITSLETKKSQEGHRQETGEGLLYPIYTAYPVPEGLMNTTFLNYNIHFLSRDKDILPKCFSLRNAS